MTDARPSAARDIASTLSRVPTVTPGEAPRRAHAGAAWRALCDVAGAMGSREATATLGDAAPDATPWMVPAVLEAVGAVLVGRKPVPDAELAGPAARRVLRAMRQELAVAGAAARPSIPVAELRRVLAALDAVEDALPPAAAAPAQAPTALLPDIPEYVAELAHDLRSPLTSVLFLVDSLRSGAAGPLTKAQQRQLTLVYVAAFGLCGVANDLLDAARSRETSASTVGGGSRPVAFSVTETLYGVRDIVLPIAEERNVVLTLVPPVVDGRLGHPSAIARILLNLVSNALRESQNGRVEMAVCECEGDVLEYRVTDTGPGIAPERIAQLFNGVRTDPSRPRDAFSSAGLGLAICRRVAESIGGALRVTSAPGVGTTFILAVRQPPARSAADNAATPAVIAADASGTSTSEHAHRTIGSEQPLA